MFKPFLFQAIQFSQTVLVQTILFSISMQLVLFNPYQVLTLRARVDLGAMAMTNYSNGNFLHAKINGSSHGVHQKSWAWLNDICRCPFEGLRQFQCESWVSIILQSLRASRLGSGPQQASGWVLHGREAEVLSGALTMTAWNDQENLWVNKQSSPPCLHMSLTPQKLQTLLRIKWK